MPETDAITAETFTAVVAEVKQHFAPQTVTLKGGPGTTDTQVLVMPPGLTAFPASTFATPRPLCPDRYEGTATMTDLDSFIVHVNRFRDDDSVIFADTTMTSPSLTAVLDYHKARWRDMPSGDEEPSTKVLSPVDLPRFGVHRTHYAFPVSDRYQAWKDKNKKTMTQEDFAAFLEDHTLDLQPAPLLDDPRLIEPVTEDDPPQLRADKELRRITDLLRGRWGGPETLMDMSRGLSLHATDKVDQIVNLSSGAGRISFLSDHETVDKSGANVEVPSLFCIGIPIFENGDKYRIAVRLRYRRSQSSLVWFYELYQDGDVFRHALDEALEKTGCCTGLPVLRGKPEPTLSEPPRSFATATTTR